MENKAKAKAEELVKLFGEPVKCKVTLNVSLPISMHIEQQVKCALICVEEIMKTTFSKYKIWDKWKIIPQVESTTEFWQEVKEHLNAMK